MRYLLDTNACIDFLNGSNAPLTRRLRKHSPTVVLICSVVKAELLYGYHQSDRRSSNLETLSIFFRTIASLPFDDRCAEHYGQIRSELKRSGKMIGANDLLIAAIALANDLTLITHNVKEFSRVPSLTLEDWFS
ncbi:MAG: type II toxin-antitoxin system VapC family toxin [Acidobacteriota bacterium]